jgi:hypothetical protein
VRPEVAGEGVLLVGHGRLPTLGDDGDGVDEAVDVVDVGEEPGTGADGAGDAPPVAPADRLVVAGNLLLAQVEEAQQVGVGAEAAVAHADAELAAQPGRHQGVRDVLDDEGGDRQAARPGARTEQAHPVDPAEPVVQPADELVVVGADAVPAQPVELVDGRVEGDGTDDVG